MTYTLKTDSQGNDYVEFIDTDGTIRYVPIAEANSDYQRYLRWLNGEDEDGTLS